jgi:hypothetical protein
MDFSVTPVARSTRIAVSRGDTSSDATVFVFGLIESAIAKGVAEILFRPMGDLEEVAMEFGFANCYYRQPALSPIQFCYVALYLPFIANRAPEGEIGERFFAAQNQNYYHLRFGTTEHPERDAALSIWIEQVEVGPSVDGGFGGQ